jgi:hypothetical protein
VIAGIWPSREMQRSRRQGARARSDRRPLGRSALGVRTLGGRTLGGRTLGGIALVLVLAAVATGCAGGPEARVWPPAGSRVFSPYSDVTLAAPFDLAGVASDAGARSLTLAFVTGSGRCRPAWGAGTSIQAPAVADPAARLRAAGVALRISFGGAQGEELARRCPDAKGLEAAYASVLDGYHAVAADFDLEGAALADRQAMALRARAIALLQARAGRQVSVSLTLPASPRGLLASSLAAVRTMVAAGVRLDTVNLLAMDFAPAEVRGGMASAAILATRGAHRQLLALRAGLSRWSSLGVTAMVGVNDVSGEVFTLADAQTLARFVDGRGLGLTSIWSLARDGPCAGSPSAADPTCSGVSEPPYAFSRAFGARPKPGVPARRAADTS